jgi:hypothetical protein
MLVVIDPSRDPTSDLTEAVEFLSVGLAHFFDTSDRIGETWIGKVSDSCAWFGGGWVVEHTDIRMKTDISTFHG